MKTAIIALLALTIIGGTLALTLGPLTAQEFVDAQDDPRFYNELGFQLAQGGDMRAAQDAFATAVRLDPAYENARKNLYVAAFQNEQYLLAAEHLRVLLADRPTAQERFDLAQALVAHARYQATDGAQAVAELEEAIALLDAAGDYPHARENAVIVRRVLAAALKQDA